LTMMPTGLYRSIAAVANFANKMHGEIMPTRNISLTDRLDRFVETSVTTGRYQNASEVVREGLRLLQQRQQEDMLKLRRLRQAIQEGKDALARGEYRDINLDELPEFLAGLGVTGQKPSRT